jgi:hypothetical protein
VPPAGVRRDIWGSGTELRLYWKNTPGLRYSVYRRDYKTGGTYERMAEPSEQPFYTEKNIADGKIYGFVVVAMDSISRMVAIPTVNNIGEATTGRSEVSGTGRRRARSRQGAGSLETGGTRARGVEIVPGRASGAQA